MTYELTAHPFEMGTDKEAAVKVFEEAVMTPTDELRARLDERGIKWWPDKYYKDTNTCWHANGFEWRASQQKDGKLLIGCTSLEHLTPEQAITATVGVEETYTREECEAQFARGFSLGSLPSGSDPQWDENRQTLDEHMAELGWVRKDAATMGTGTCKNVGEGTFVCSKCGAHVQVTDVGRSYVDENGKRWYGTSNEHKFRHCPNCGRRLVSE